jgi:exocyst complex component 5
VGKSTMIGRMMNQIGSSGTSGTSGQAAQVAAAALMRFGGLGSSATSGPPPVPEKPGEEPIREEDGKLSLEIAEKMLKWHAEAIGRCVELSPSADV